MRNQPLSGPLFADAAKLRDKAAYDSSTEEYTYERADIVGQQRPTGCVFAQAIISLLRFGRAKPRSGYSDTSHWLMTTSPAPLAHLRALVAYAN